MPPENQENAQESHVEPTGEDITASLLAAAAEKGLSLTEDEPEGREVAAADAETDPDPEAGEGDEDAEDGDEPEGSEADEQDSEEADDGPEFLQPEAYEKAVKEARERAIAPYAERGAQIRDSLKAIESKVQAYDDKLNADPDYEPTFKEKRDYDLAQEAKLDLKAEYRGFWAKVEPLMDREIHQINLRQIDAQVAATAKKYPKLAPYKAQLKELHSEGALPSHPDDALALIKSRLKRSGKAIPAPPAKADVERQRKATAEATRRLARVGASSAPGTQRKGNVIDLRKGLKARDAVAFDEFNKALG